MVFEQLFFSLRLISHKKFFQYTSCLPEQRLHSSPCLDLFYFLHCYFSSLIVVFVRILQPFFFNLFTHYQTFHFLDTFSFYIIHLIFRHYYPAFTLQLFERHVFYHNFIIELASRECFSCLYHVRFFQI